MNRYKIKTSHAGDFEVEADNSWDAIHQFIWNSIVDHVRDRSIDYGEIIDVIPIDQSGESYA